MGKTSPYFEICFISTIFDCNLSEENVCVNCCQGVWSFGAFRERIGRGYWSSGEVDMIGLCPWRCWIGEWYEKVGERCNGMWCESCKSCKVMLMLDISRMDNTSMGRFVTAFDPRMFALNLPFSLQIASGAYEWLPTTCTSVSDVSEASSWWWSMIAPVTESSVATVILEDLLCGTVHTT